VKPFLLTILLLGALVHRTPGQIRQRSVGNCTVFTIPFRGDTVTFAVAGPPAELKKRKPILLFRQGSLPIPLFTIAAKTGQPALTELPSTYYTHQSEYHILMIAKAGLPLVVQESYLDTLFGGIPKPAMYPAAYHAHNYLDYYVDQSNAVLDFVLKQPWSDPQRVVLVGGSEGYQVSIKTAYTNPRITHLIAFSGTLEGRRQAQIREARASGYGGGSTPEAAQQAVEALQQEWAAVCRDSMNVTATFGDANRSIYSFSHNQNLTYLLALEIPICILYGTADVRSTSNDSLPLEFARHGKTNLTLKAYLNHDHTFHQLTYDANGRVINKSYNGAAVQRDYFAWLKQH